MHNKAHCYWCSAILCSLGMVLYNLCARCAQYASIDVDHLTSPAVLCFNNLHMQVHMHTDTHVRLPGRGVGYSER